MLWALVLQLTHEVPNLRWGAVFICVDLPDIELLHVIGLDHVLEGVFAGHEHTILLRQRAELLAVVGVDALQHGLVLRALLLDLLGALGQSLGQRCGHVLGHRDADGRVQEGVRVDLPVALLVFEVLRFHALGGLDHLRLIQARGVL